MENLNRRAILAGLASATIAPPLALARPTFGLQSLCRQYREALASRDAIHDAMQAKYDAIGPAPQTPDSLLQPLGDRVPFGVRWTSEKLTSYIKTETRKRWIDAIGPDGKVLPVLEVRSMDEPDLVEASQRLKFALEHETALAAWTSQIREIEGPGDDAAILCCELIERVTETPARTAVEIKDKVAAMVADDLAGIGERAEAMLTALASDIARM